MRYGVSIFHSRAANRAPGWRLRRRTTAVALLLLKPSWLSQALNAPTLDTPLVYARREPSRRPAYQLQDSQSGCHSGPSLRRRNAPSENAGGLLREAAHEPLQAGHSPANLCQQARALAAAIVPIAAAALCLCQDGIQCIACAAPDRVGW